MLLDTNQSEVAVKVRTALTELAGAGITRCFIVEDLDEEEPYLACSEERTRRGVRQLVRFANLVAKVAESLEVDVVDSVTNLFVDHLLKSTDSDLDQASDFVLNWVYQFEGRTTEIAA